MTDLFEQLVADHAGLIYKYGGWDVPGMDRDDVTQELLLVAHRCRLSYRPGGPAKFSTFLVRAFVNRLGQLGAHARRRAPVWYPLPEGLDAAAPDELDARLEELELEERCAGLGSEAVEVLELALATGRRARAGRAVRAELEELSRGCSGSDDS